MFIEGIQLKVKLGPYALDVMDLQQLGKELGAAHSVITTTESLLNQTNIVSTNITLDYKCEEAALRYVYQKRNYLATWYIAEDIFHRFQTFFLHLVEEERVARGQLDNLYADIKIRIAQARRSEYFMSTKCVYERFDVEEEAREKKMNLLQDYIGFLAALKMMEEEERQEAIRRAKVRRQQTLQHSAQGSHTNSFPTQSSSTHISMGVPMGFVQTPPTQFTQYQSAPQQIPSKRPYELPATFLQNVSSQYSSQQTQLTGFYASVPITETLSSVQRLGSGQVPNKQQYPQSFQQPQQQQQQSSSPQVQATQILYPTAPTGYSQNGPEGARFYGL